MVGQLVDGRWTTNAGPATTDASGGFVRKATTFRNWITPEGDFPAEPGRYHLYVSYACPWAHRTLIFRALKALEDMVSLSVVNWHMGEKGWTFAPGPGVIPDPINHAKSLSDVYVAAVPNFSGRVTV